MDDLLTAKQVAKMLGCSEKTVYGWAETGHLGFPAIKLGSGRKSPLRFEPEKIRQWVRYWAERTEADRPQGTDIPDTWYNGTAETVARPRKGVG